MVTSISTKFGELTVEQCEDGFVLFAPETAGDTKTVASKTTAVSEHVRTDDSGRYRPLSGARTLPSGWKTLCSDQTNLEAAIDAVYPLAQTHQRRWRYGTLKVVALDDVLARQSGRYAGSSALSDTGRSLATKTLCGDCVRTPIWGGDRMPLNGIPCPEACSVLVALCREAVTWERDSPATSEPDPSVGYADFEQPGNALREKILLNMNSSERS